MAENPADTSPEEKVVIHPCDIVQVTDEKHNWHLVLVVIESVRSWGAQGFAFIPKNGPEPTGQAYIRLPAGSFEKVGEAVMVPPELIKAREQSIETARLVAQEAAR